jgi:hypothetical protein
MYAALIYLYPGHRLLTVGVRFAAGGLIYGALMVVIDSDARAFLGKVRGRLRPKAKS